MTDRSVEITTKIETEDGARIDLDFTEPDGIKLSIWRGQIRSLEATVMMTNAEFDRLVSEVEWARKLRTKIETEAA